MLRFHPYGISVMKIVANNPSARPAQAGDARLCVLYARVSSKEQETEGYSIPSQLKLLRGEAERRTLNIAREFTDAESAKGTGRAAFNEMLAFLKANPGVKYLLCEKTDRLSRNFRDIATLDDLMNDQELVIILVKENVEISKDSQSNAKLIFGFKALLSKNYIDNLSEEVKKGLLEKAEQGKYPGKAPVGYIHDEANHTIGLDMEKAPIIRKLFEWYSSGSYSLTALRQECVKIGFTTRRSEKRISRSNLEHALKNIFYTGHFYWHGKLYKGAHPAIVSMELFNAVQEAFGRHNKPRPGKYGKNFPFAGLLTCGCCGCAITAEIKKAKYVYYHCTAHKGKCGQPYIREEVLAEKLGDIIKAIHVGEDKVEWIRQALHQSHGDEREYHENTLKSLQVRYTKLQERIDQAYTDKLDGKISADFWEARSSQWRKEQAEIRLQMTAHEGANRSYLDDGIRVLELANRAYSLYLSQDAHEKARLLRVVLSNCTLKGLTPYPVYRKPFDIFAKGLQTQDWLGD